MQLTGVLQEGGVAARRYNRHLDALWHVGDVVDGGVVHRAGMEGHQLVAILVGDAEALRGVLAADGADEAVVDAGALQVLAVGLEVLAHRAHHQRCLAEQAQAVGDVAGRAAKLAAHGRHLEGGRDLVQLIGQNMVIEAVFEIEQRVVG
ncbi:hypothetical protein D3C85_1347010 [compost metagenome]